MYSHVIWAVQVGFVTKNQFLIIFHSSCGKESVFREFRRGSDAVSLYEVDQMCQSVARSGGEVAGGQLGVDGLGQGQKLQRSLAQGLKDLRLAIGPMRQEKVDPLQWGLDRCAMTRQEAPWREIAQEGTAVAKGGGVAIGRRDQRGGPAHDQIAGKHHVLPVKTEVIAHVAGRMQRGDRTCLGFNHGPMGQSDIRGKALIHTFAAANLIAKRGHHRAASCQSIAKGIDRRAGGVRERPRAFGMIAMRMGDEDVGQTRALRQGVEDRRAVIGQIGAGVDQHAGLPVAQEIAVRAPIGHQGRVRRQDADQARDQVRDQTWGEGGYGIGTGLHAIVLCFGLCLGLPRERFMA